MAESRIDVRAALFEGDLSAQLARPHSPEAVSLYWLGQAGFIFACGVRFWLIDPYLSDSLAEKYLARNSPIPE